MHCAVPLSGLDLLCANWSDCGLLPPKIDLARNLRRAESPLWDVLWCSRWRTHATRWAMAAIGWANQLPGHPIPSRLQLIQLLCLNSGSAFFGGRIWRPITSQRRTKAVPIQGLLQMQPCFPSFWRINRYYPSWPHISQDYLRTQRRKTEKTWRLSN